MEQRIDNEIYIVSTCDATHNGWKHHWDKFPYNFKWLYHNEEGKGKDFVYTEQEMCDNLGFKGEVSKKHYWNSFGNRNIVWFYAHFRMLNFYKQNPQWDYYWFFDDDVTCDNWVDLLDNFKKPEHNEDFLAWFVFSKEDYGDNIRPLDKDTTSQHMWFERFPGDGDKLPWYIEQWYGSFFPVVRYSWTALNTLNNQFKWDWSGYSEGFVPTILNYYKHSLGSLFQSDGTSQYYDVTKIDLKHKHQKIGWEWI
jgi:hypothetical protein